MRRIETLKAAGLALAAAFAAGCSADAAGSPEEAARHAAEALRTGDFEKIKVLALSLEDLDWALDRVEQTQGREARRSAEARMKRTGEPEEQIRKISARRERRFRKIVEAASASFDLGRARFDGLGEVTKGRMRGTVQEYDIHFWLKADGVRYHFKLDDCFKTNRGWVCRDGLRYLGPEPR